MTTLSSALRTLTEFAVKGAPEDELIHVYDAVATVAAAANLPHVTVIALRICDDLRTVDRARMEAGDQQLIFIEMLRSELPPPPSEQGPGGGAQPDPDAGAGS